MKDLILLGLVAYTFFYIGKGVGVAFTHHYYTEVVPYERGEDLCS